MWDIWKEYNNDIAKPKIKEPACNTYFYGQTENDYINTLKGVYKMNPAQLAGRDIFCEDDLVTYAKSLYSFIHKDYWLSGFQLYPPDLIGQINDLKFRLDKKRDFLINIWNENTQQFDTVSMQELIDKLNAHKKET